MKTSHLEPLSLPSPLKKYEAHNLVVESQALQGNPLGDPFIRHNYCLVPKDRPPYPVIFHLSGYFSTGYHSFHPKTLRSNFVEKIDQLRKGQKIPAAVHIFVEATTCWGGSQFIDSPGSGKYAQYILKDLYPAAVAHLPILTQRSHTWVMGGSSGGYGALSLISQKKSPFGQSFAVAPDSYFEASLLPELFQAAPELLKYKTFRQLRKAMDQGKIPDPKTFFNLANVVAMAHCYAPENSFKKGFLEFPLDLHRGEIKASLWRQWLKKDPLHFLKARQENLKGRVVHLEVGKYDNFSLQFGARQMAHFFKQASIKHSYGEFNGNHFNLSERQLEFLQKIQTC